MLIYNKSIVGVSLKRIGSLYLRLPESLISSDRRQMCKPVEIFDLFQLVSLGFLEQKIIRKSINLN